MAPQGGKAGQVLWKAGQSVQKRIYKRKGCAASAGQETRAPGSPTLLSYDMP